MPSFRLLFALTLALPTITMACGDSTDDGLSSPTTSSALFPGVGGSGGASASAGGASATGGASEGGFPVVGPSGQAGEGQGGASGEGGAPASAGGGPGAGGGAIDKSAACADSFGEALTAPYGRIDGTVVAVVKPTDTHCAYPNNDHVVLQVSMQGKVYRMVINVESTMGDPRVHYLEIAHALPAPAFEEGWHTGVRLDYVGDLGVHSGDFTPYDLTTLSDKVADAITIGQQVSVYAATSGGKSAHKVHRNDGKQDGAVVLDPTSDAPRLLLFHFDEQVF